MKGDMLTLDDLVSGREIFTGDEFEKLDCLTEFEKKLLELKYAGQKTYREIAELVAMEVVVDGTHVSSRAMSKSAIEKAVKRAVKKICTSTSGQNPL